MKRLAVVVLVLVLALGLMGCKSISERIGEEIAGGVIGGDVKVDGENVTIQTDEGAVTIEGDTGEIPADFPADFPDYPDATVDSASKVVSEDDANFYVNLISDDAVKDVYDWYKAEFLSEGWEIKSDALITSGGEDSGMLSVEKERMKGTVSLAPAGGHSEIGIILLVEGP